jgi:hypothetical protein
LLAVDLAFLEVIAVSSLVAETLRDEVALLLSGVSVPGCSVFPAEPRGIKDVKSKPAKASGMIFILL